MNRLLSLPGGQCLKAEDWELIQDATVDSIKALVLGLTGQALAENSPVVVAGLQVSYPGDQIAITAGLLWDGSEVCYVPAAQFTFQYAEVDGSGVAGWRLIFNLNETSSENRTFKDGHSHNVYKSRQYQVAYTADSLPVDALEMPPRMLDEVAAYIAPLVPIPASVVSYKKYSFSSSSLDQYREFLPAPGAGKAIQIISLSAHISPVSQLNVGNQTLKVFFGTDYEEGMIGELPTAFLQTISQWVQLMTIGPNMFINEPVCLAFSAGSQPSSGSATIIIHCVYKIITL